MIELAPMTLADLAVVAGWLGADHVARWWLTDTTAPATLATYRARVIDARSPTRMLIVRVDGTPVGFCQSYCWGDHPDEAAVLAASNEEFGFDYCIGAAGRIGQGLGTELIGVLVRRLLAEHPGVGFVVDPAADNEASRRVLEKNGFQLVRLTGDGHAVYRRPAG